MKKTFGLLMLGFVAIAALQGFFPAATVPGGAEAAAAVPEIAQPAAGVFTALAASPFSDIMRK